MKFSNYASIRLALVTIAVLLAAAGVGFGFTPVNPIVFVTQPPIPRELNGSGFTMFLSSVSMFGNHLADTAHAARGGSLWLMTTNGTFVNLTQNAGFGVTGDQSGVGIAVRDPAVHWSGKKLLFSMVVGSPTNATDTTSFVWQLYEVTNLDAVIANNSATPAIVRVANQPTNYNNINGSYGTGGRLIFTSDRPFENQAWLYPQRDEYKGAPTVTGTFSLDPVTGDLRLLEHLPSGAFNPFVDSFGRLIVTRWDHLVQDAQAADDRLGLGTYGSFNFLSEAASAGTQSTNIIETFPEPVDFDTAYAAQLGVNTSSFNFLFPWALDPNGGNEEILNHVGRHELLNSIKPSFTDDPNLATFTNYLHRPLVGIESVNTNYLDGFQQITEDPSHPGTYFGVDAGDVSIFGGTHAAGQILTLTGPPTLNPTGMFVTYITPKTTAYPSAPNNLGVFRNPLPMSDGTIVAAYTPTGSSVNFGYDTNTGTASAPVSRYKFRLMTLAKIPGALWTTNQLLTPGFTGNAIYWDGATRVTNSGALWELEPVEVRARPEPPAVVTPVQSIEQNVFIAEGVDLPTFQADLAQRNLALVVSRNVTARDAADREQPYNLQIPGGVETLGTNSGKIYSITHLQYQEADYLRGYTFGTATNQPGRRVLATPLQATMNLNYPSGLASPPPGGIQLMPDGSQATIVPAGRAITWQLTGAANESVIKERYWINFRPGEVRTCANCHGINDKDQAGNPPPTNDPQALHQLLRQWRTNAANACTLTVNNGAGGGSYGAGSLLTLTASAPPPGQAFAGWTGPGITTPATPTTQFIMPIGDTVVSATYTNTVPPKFSNLQYGGGNLTLTATTGANQTWILQDSANLATWTDILTNTSSIGGILQYTFPVNAGTPHDFFRLRSP